MIIKTINYHLVPVGIVCFMTIFFISTVNCVDRHAQKYPDKVALIWEKDKPGEDETVTYR